MLEKEAWAVRVAGEKASMLLKIRCTLKEEGF